MLNTLATILISALVSVGSFFGLYKTNPPEIQIGSTLPIAGSTYNLSGSGVSSSATSITLQSFTLTQTGQKIADSDLSPTFYITLEPGNKTRQEIVSCTTVTQNSGGTATLSGCSRGLSPITPYTASTTLAFAHAGGSQVVFSDPPQLFNMYPAKANDETITGTWTFDVFPVTPDNSLASETAVGVVELATGLETASSTSSGTVGRLAIPATQATSTYNSATAPLKLVATQNDGKIDVNFLQLKGYVGNASSTQLTVSDQSWLGSTTIATTTSSFFTYLQKVFASTTVVDIDSTSEEIVYAMDLKPGFLTNGMMKLKTVMVEENVAGNACSSVFSRLYLGGTVIASSSIIYSPQDYGRYEWNYTILSTGATSQLIDYTVASSTAEQAGGIYTLWQPLSYLNYATSTGTSALDTSQVLNLKLTMSRAATNATCAFNHRYSYGEIIR